LNKLRFFTLTLSLKENQIMATGGITMPMNANWKARFLLCLVGPVKVSGLQSAVANLSNRVIGGPYQIGVSLTYAKFG
jgi:hypothetical protein